jgi:hypothetical protein
VAIQGGPSGYTTVFATGETLISPTQIRCSLVIPSNAFVGPYGVWVRIPGGNWIGKAGAFTVTGPIVTGISPASAARGTTLATVDVFGTNFMAGSEVVIDGGTGGYTVVFATGETVLSPTQIRCTLAIPSTAYAGPYDVNVGSPDGTWVYKAAAFTVTTGTPTPTPGAITVTGIAPASAARGTTVTADVTGTGFVAGAEVRIQGGTYGTTTVLATGESTVSATQVRCTLAIPRTASRGSYAVSVRNPGGTWVAKAAAFTVT